MNVIISSIEPNFYLEEKMLRGRYSEFFLFYDFGEFAVRDVYGGHPFNKSMLFVTHPRFRYLLLLKYRNGIRALLT